MVEKFGASSLQEKDWEWREEQHRADNDNTRNIRNTVETCFYRITQFLNGGTRYMGIRSMNRGRGRTGSLPYYVRFYIFSSTHP